MLDKPKSSLSSWLGGGVLCVLAIVLTGVGSSRGLLELPDSTERGGETITWQPGLPSGVVPLTGTATPAAETVPPQRTLAETLDDAIGAERGVYGLMVIDSDGAVAYQHNPTVPFVAASLYKLPLLATMYSLIEQGQLSLETTIWLEPDYFADETGDSYYSVDDVGMATTVETALMAAGAWSSNVAARALLTLTSWDALAATARQLGMNDTYFEVLPEQLASWPPTPGTGNGASDVATAVAFVDQQAAAGPLMLTTPADIAHFFQQLQSGAVVSPKASAAILAILRQQTVNDRFPALLPDDTPLAHKTGNLEAVVHDAGIIETANGPVIVVAMTEAVPDETRSTNLLQQIARTVYGWKTTGTP